MPRDPAPASSSATERIVYADPEHRAVGDAFEFYEWHCAGRGVPWRTASCADYSALLDEGWELHAVVGNVIVLFRMRFDNAPPDEPAKEVSDFPADALPDDIADAYETMKLALMRHRAEGWFNIGVDSARRMLECLASYCYEARRTKP